MQSDRATDCSLTQQQLLMRMMDEFELTQEQLGARLCVTVRALDRWLLPPDHPDARAMPESGKAYVRDLLEEHVVDFARVAAPAPPRD
ncbi:hypothetical protein FAZ69_00460 [Trinickia terrae]|uniref:XRE family transcriptional regulator n=1 Tax=Trinickia terrae TaxID=2571161 RepID=A0A4U1IEX3_9BURK|nr:hypothetical protein FAZ69_00460 [Trinickia terrae]